MSAADDSENLPDHSAERLNPNGWRVISNPTRRRDPGADGCVAEIALRYEGLTAAFDYAATPKRLATNFACPVVSLPSNLLTCPLPIM